ncbi:hypothetical protein K3495_g392 [Podosphaera aphanis]|nr:hypothetical protein K3495_g392 [Podosphaera aphanis]
MKGYFDDKNIWIKDGDKIMLHAIQNDRLYILKHIAAELEGRSLDTITENLKACSTAEKMELTEGYKKKEIGLLEDDPAETKEERARYRLIHGRFGHYGPGIIGKLHKVSNIEKINILVAGKRICKSCKIGKIRNKISKNLAPHKKESLELISFDIAGPFPTTLRGNRYFMQIIDNWSRRIRSIPLKTKDQAIQGFKKIKLREEHQTGKQLKAARSDNAPKLKNFMEQWQREDGVVADFIAIASSHQNGPAERSIQTAEMAMRTMIDDAELPIEFWDEAVECDS